MGFYDNSSPLGQWGQPGFTSSQGISARAASDAALAGVMESALSLSNGWADWVEKRVARLKSHHPFQSTRLDSARSKFLPYSPTAPIIPYMVDTSAIAMKATIPPMTSVVTGGIIEVIMLVRSFASIS
jgi:hypothetical protein